MADSRRPTAEPARLHFFPLELAPGAVGVFEVKSRHVFRATNLVVTALAIHAFVIVGVRVGIHEQLSAGTVSAAIFGQSMSGMRDLTIDTAQCDQAIRVKVLNCSARPEVFAGYLDGVTAR